MTVFTRSTPEAVDLMRRVERVRGVDLTCVDCGRLSRCRVETRMRMPTINGGDGEYGTCDECRRLRDRHGRDFARAVAANLLDVDVDNLALNELKAERFADRASARPDRPNGQPWGHVDVDALAVQYRDHEDTLVGLNGGPCAWCGTILSTAAQFEPVRIQVGNGTFADVPTPSGGGWRKLRGGRDVPQAARQMEQCESCSTWFDDNWGAAGSQDRRSMATAALVGLMRVGDSRTRVPYAGFGDDVGLRFWCETGLSEGATRPWAHVNIKALRRAAVDATQRYATSVAREFVIDVDNPRPIQW